MADELRRDAGSAFPSWPGTPGDPPVAPATAPDAAGGPLEPGRIREQLADELSTEAPTRDLGGRTRWLVAALATGLAAFALYWAVAIVPPHLYRWIFLLIVLVLTFLLYPAAPRQRGAVTVRDWILVASSILALGWPVLDRLEFPFRAATPGAVDLLLGTVAILLVLEATRRTVGWILPLTAVLFLLYAYVGPLLDLIGLGLIAHRGYYPDRLVGSLYMTLEGIFGTPLDVTATYIILFAIYGAVLERTGAARFFIDWALAALGRSAGGAGPARSVTAAGFLLGTVSGSGVATTVTLGSVAWPLFRRAGFPAETAGGILAAAGIGAILSPPTMGAAAFLIAEFLEVSYLQVLTMALLPTALYYLSALLMAEADARRLGTREVPLATQSLLHLTIRQGHFFISPAIIVALMILGVTPFRAVLWATVVAALLGLILGTEGSRVPRLAGALMAGGKGVLSVAATTATAGIIVGVVTLTGLGLKLSGILVSLAGGSMVLTVLYAALAVWILGLAVPVTASYIIAAVMIAPALTAVGIPLMAAHMFIFYYAVLSEVSPPTALSPFAAAAITGGDPFRTMMLTWKYTLPAFLVPFAFTLTDGGSALLLQAGPLGVMITTVTSAIGVSALAMTFGGWLRGPASPAERILAGSGGLLLMLGDGAARSVGLGAVLVAVAVHWIRVSRARMNVRTAG